MIQTQRDQPQPSRDAGADCQERFESQLSSHSVRPRDRCVIFHTILTDVRLQTLQLAYRTLASVFAAYPKALVITYVQGAARAPRVLKVCECACIYVHVLSTTRSSH